MKQKLIFLDIDGTLLNSAHELPPGSRDSAARYFFLNS